MSGRNAAGAVLHEVSLAWGQAQQRGPALIGAVIGNYQIVRKLGEGGMGVVYLGQHTLLGRRAAIKVLLPTLSARPDIVNRFFNEARAVTTISDPGIVQVFDFGYHTDGSAFIVMEFLEGEALDRRLARLGKLPSVEALRLCRQIASSLAAAHAQHIIHRDLKPENIFLVRDGEVASGERSKILDFGIAKLSDEHPGKVKTTTGALSGRWRGDRRGLGHARRRRAEPARRGGLDLSAIGVLAARPALGPGQE
jgi:serine/threonine protein kinase